MNLHYTTLNTYLLPVFLLVAVALSQSSCKTDPCSGITCENDGICIGGGCDCPEGFTGVRCEIELDPCIQRNCDSAGTDSCLVSPITGEARCVCKDGYEGLNCQSRWEDKFADNYTASEVCGTISDNFPVTVETGPEPGQITLVNFNNRQPNNIPAKIVANLLTPTAFQIYQQFMPFGEVTGQGGYRNSDGAIEYSFQIITNTDTLICSTLLQPS